MNILELNDKIVKAFESDDKVNSVYVNDPYKVWNAKDVNYTSVAFYPNSSTIGTNVNSLRYTIYCGDRLIEDNSNEYFIYENCQKIIENAISILRKDNDILDIEDFRNYTFLPQKFNDVLAVTYVDVTFVLKKDVKNC